MKKVLSVIALLLLASAGSYAQTLSTATVKFGNMDLIHNAIGKITPNNIRSCLFPQQVRDAAGNIAATRPAKYDAP